MSRAARSPGEGLRHDRNGTPKQLLHLVFGGELKSLDSVEFKDLDKLDIVGVYPNYATAYAAWKGQAQRTVDNALMRYFIVHMHRLLDPATDATRQKAERIRFADVVVEASRASALGAGRSRHARGGISCASSTSHDARR